MPLPAAIPLALLSSLPSIIAGIVGKGQHNKFASFLEDMAKDLPTGIEAGEDIFRELASKGMPGYEVAKERIGSTMPTTMSVAKDVVDSPSALLGVLAKGQEGVTSQIRQLNVQNEAARMANMGQYASYLSGPYAGAQIRQQQMRIGAQEERMLGTSELFGGITQGIGGGMQGYGTGKFLDYAKDNPSAWEQFMGGGMAFGGEQDQDILDYNYGSGGGSAGFLG